MSVMTDLLSKLRFIRGMKLNVVELETALVSVGCWIPRWKRIGNPRPWYTQHAAEEFRRSEYARRAFNENAARAIISR